MKHNSLLNYNQNLLIKMKSEFRFYSKIIINFFYNRNLSLLHTKST